MAKPGCPIKDVDSVGQAMMINNFCRIFPLIGVAGFIFKGFSGILIAAPISAVIAVAGVGLSGILSNAAVNVFYGMRNGNWTLREQLAGDLSKVRVQKMNNRFDDALVSVEGILARDPDHPEALFLKAQILWEGYGDRSGARDFLIKAAKAEPDGQSPLHRWARSLYRDMYHPK